MKITAIEATDHIVNSLDNSDAADWYDKDNDVTWSVRFGGNDSIEIAFIDNDDNETTQRFKLVETV